MSSPSLDTLEEVFAALPPGAARDAGYSLLRQVRGLEFKLEESRTALERLSANREKDMDTVRGLEVRLEELKVSAEAAGEERDELLERLAKTEAERGELVALRVQFDALRDRLALAEAKPQQESERRADERLRKRDDGARQMLTVYAALRDLGVLDVMDKALEELEL